MRGCVCLPEDDGSIAEPAAACPVHGGCGFCGVGPEDDCTDDCPSRHRTFVCDGCTTPDDPNPDQRAARARCSRCGTWAFGYKIVA